MNKLVSILVIMIISLSGLMPLINVNATPVYYGNFQYSTLLQSSGFVRVWKVNNYTDTVIYDDSTTIWNDITASYTYTADSYHGSSATKITGSGYIGISVYPPINFSAIYFYAKGGSSNNPHIAIFGLSNYISLNFILTPSYSQYIFYHNYVSTSDEAIYFYSTDSSNFYVDYLVYRIGNPYDYYQVWDGSTLKYTGLSQPDINDFIIKISPPQTVVNNDWFYLLMLFAIFIISVISYKISILILPTFVLDLWLILNKDYYLSNMSLLYMIILILSIFMTLMSLTRRE